MMGEKRLVPKKRFQNFIEEWIEISLGDLSDSFQYGLNAESKKFDGKNKYIRITDIDDDTRLFVKSNLTSPSIDYTVSDDYILSEGDILFARTGASVGKTYKYETSDGKVYFAGFLIKARIKNEYDSEFIFQNTLTKQYNHFVSVTSQRSGQPGINAQEYSRYKLMIPVLQEQQKIGEFFKVLDERIANQERKIAKVKALKTAYLTEMFPQEGETVPNRRFKGFDEDWERHLFSNIMKTHSFKSYLAKPKSDGKYEVIQQGDTPIVGYSNKSPFKEYSNVVLFGDHTLSLFKPNRPFLIATDGIKILEIEKVPGEFLFVLLKKYLPKSEGYKRHFTILQNQYCYIPSNINEQHKIGQFFKNLDDQIATEEKKLEKLKKMKEAYLEEMFV